MICACGSPAREHCRCCRIASTAPPYGEYDALSSALDTAKGRQKTIIKTELREKFPAGSPKARRPVLAGWQTYQKRHPADSQEGVIEGPFDADFIVLTKLEGIVLGLESTLQLTGALRDAAMKVAIRPPEWLSGHDSAGQPTRKIHAAFFPLPYVGFKHADGHVMGSGIALPRGMRNSAELRQVLGPLFFDEKTGEERPVRLWEIARRTQGLELGPRARDARAASAEFAARRLDGPEPHLDERHAGGLASLSQERRRCGAHRPGGVRLGTVTRASGSAHRSHIQRGGCGTGDVPTAFHRGWGEPLPLSNSYAGPIRGAGAWAGPCGPRQISRIWPFPARGG